MIVLQSGPAISRKKYKLLSITESAKLRLVFACILLINNLIYKIWDWCICSIWCPKVNFHQITTCQSFCKKVSHMISILSTMRLQGQCRIIVRVDCVLHASSVSYCLSFDLLWFRFVSKFIQLKNFKLLIDNSELSFYLTKTLLHIMSNAAIQSLVRKESAGFSRV